MRDTDKVMAAIARNVRSLRASRGFTLDVLAARAGVSRGMLIQVEQARTNPSLGALTRLCDALGVSLAELVAVVEPPTIRLVPADAAVALWRGEQPGSISRLLIGTPQPSAMELWDWHIAPGDAYDGDPHQTGTQEALYVLAGALTLDVGGHQVTARVGDSVAFHATRPHRYANRGPEHLRFVMAVALPPVPLPAAPDEPLGEPSHAADP